MRRAMDTNRGVRTQRTLQLRYYASAWVGASGQSITDEVR